MASVALVQAVPACVAAPATQLHASRLAVQATGIVARASSAAASHSPARITAQAPAQRLAANATAAVAEGTGVAEFVDPARPAIRSKVRYTRRPADQEQLWLSAKDMSTNMHWEDVGIDVYDARPMAGRTSLDVEGFEIHVADSQVPSWDDEAAVTSVFYAEAVDLVKKATGAKHAWVFDHTFRRVDNTRPGRPSGGDPVHLVHVDYSSASAKKRLADFFGPAVAANSGRFAIINLWRPVVDVVYDKPLGLIDATTVPGEDLSAYNLLLKDRVGQNQTVHPNEARHRWYYLPQQRGNEVYLFKQFDSDASKTQWTPHSAFHDPTAPPSGTFVPRESIELRIFVFYDKDEEAIAALQTGNSTAA